MCYRNGGTNTRKFYATEIYCGVTQTSAIASSCTVCQQNRYLTLYGKICMLKLLKCTQNTANHNGCFGYSTTGELSFSIHPCLNNKKKMWLVFLLNWRIILNSLFPWKLQLSLDFTQVTGPYSKPPFFLVSEGEWFSLWKQLSDQL